MYHKGYDYFTLTPFSNDIRVCLICGTKCKVSENVFGPTNFASSIGNISTYHDKHYCQYSSENWHDKAFEITKFIDNCPVSKLKEIATKELDEIVRIGKL